MKMGHKRGNMLYFPRSPIWSHYFKSKYLYKYVSYENTKGMKSFLKFRGFSKIFKKRAGGTPNTPKTRNQNFEKSENLVLGLWGRWDLQFPQK